MQDARARLLSIRDYLVEHTDERHPITVRELTALLECAGISANRRAVYADIALLQSAGLPVQVRRRRANEYYLKERLFTAAELRLLCDMARANRSISATCAEALADKLAGLGGAHMRARLLGDRTGGCENRAKDDAALRAAEQVLSAMERHKKISFQYHYLKRNPDGAGERGAETVCVSPCFFCAAGQSWILVADRPDRDGLAHYRLERMKQVRALEEPAAPQDASFCANTYLDGVFDDSAGELRWVRLAFNLRYRDDMCDRFGAEIPTESIDETTGALYAPVRVSDAFFGWVFRFCGGVRILAPDDVRERMLVMLEAARGGCIRSPE